MNAQITNLLHSISPVVGAPTVAVTVTSTASTLATLGVTLHASTRSVLVYNETATVRECPEGGTASATLGFPLLAGGYRQISLAEATSAKWWCATTSVIQVAQFC